jgi:hypothetical protein
MNNSINNSPRQYALWLVLLAAAGGESNSLILTAAKPTLQRENTAKLSD